MATVSKGTTASGAGNQTNPAFAATMLQARTVFPNIPLNFAQNLKLLLLLADGEVNGQGLTVKAGRISKWQVETPRVESYNYDPVPVTVKVTSFNGTTLGVDTTNLTAYRLLRVTNNAAAMVCRIDSITSASACEITSVGDTAFNPSVGDDLMLLALAMPENSSGIPVMSKDYDNVYNTLQITRQAVGISNSMLKSEFLAGGSDYYKLLKNINLAEFYRTLERNFLFSARASGTGNTTAGGAALTGAFRTARGLYDFAAQSYDMKGSMTRTKLMTDLPQIMKTVKENEGVIALAGFQTIGVINEMLQDQTRYIDSGTAKTALRDYGVQTNVLRTMNMPIEMCRHEAFDSGAYQNQMLLLVPDNIRFAHLKDRDIRPVVGLQNNDVDGMIDSVEVEAAPSVIDGGLKLVVVKNCW
jgi:hypothetical protein